MKGLTVDGSLIESHINAQLVFWRQQREQLEKKGIGPGREPEPFITISREYGCGGYEVAEVIAGAINSRYRQKPEWVAYDKKILDKVMEDMGLSSQLAETLTSSVRKELTNLFQTTFSKFPPQVAVYRKLAETVRTLALHGHVIIVGRGGRPITRDLEKGFHLRLVAPMEWKVDRIARNCGVSHKEAEKIINKKGPSREAFFTRFVKFDIKDPENYDITINMAAYSNADIAALVLEGMKLKGLLK